MSSNELWKYSPQSNTWTQLPSTPDDGSRWAGSSFVLDDYVYCFQGVTRKRHYQFNNFTMIWPQQGYRMYIGGDQKNETTVDDHGDEEHSESHDGEEKDEDDHSGQSHSHDGEHGSSSDDATMDDSGSSLAWPHPIGIAVFAMTTDRIAVW